MRKTKIICTLGPAVDNDDMIKELISSGMDCARVNFSHGTHEEHRKNIAMIKKVRDELSLPIAIMLDTKGPEYRIGAFENGEIFLSDGDDFVFTTRELIGNKD